jgi:hypothetical protein
MSIINSTLPAAPAPTAGPIVQQPVADTPQAGTGIAADASGDTTATAPAPELTPRQKLEKQIAELGVKIKKDTDRLGVLTKQLENVEQIAQIVPGVGVRALVGRGETRREEVASVIAVEDGRVSIFYGQGLNSKTAVVRVEDITEVIPAAA